MRPHPSSRRHVRCAASSAAPATALSLLILTLTLTLAALTMTAGCGDDDPVTPDPETPPAGVPASEVAEAMSLLGSLRLQVRFLCETCPAEGCVDQDWQYDGEAGAWRIAYAGYSDLFVGDSQGSYTIRSQQDYAYAIAFRQAGQPADGWAEADSVHVTASLRDRRFIVQDGFELEDPHDLSLEYEVAAPVLDGLVQRASAAGEVAGWAVFPRAGGEADTLRYAGPVVHVTDATVGGWHCGALRTEIDLHILGPAGEELDRYQGVFAAGAEDDTYTGSATSAHGAGAWSVNGLRFCGQ